MKHKSQPFGLCAAAASLVFLPGVGQAADWWVKAGPVLRGGMSVNVSGSSYAQTLGLHAVPNVPGDPAGIGTLGAYADRAYDNGYVGLAPSTGNPAAINPNTTWNWGYNASSTAGQYDAGAGTLSFFKQGGPSYTPTASSSFSGDDKMLGKGFEFSIGAPFMKSGKWSFDLGLGFQGTWGANANMSGSTYAERVDQVDSTDRYNVAGITSTAFGNLNHRGAYNGPFDPAATAPYTIIPNLPAARDRQTVDLGWTAQNAVNLDVSTAFYQLSLNPGINFAVTERLSLCLTPKLSLNIVDVSANRSETFYQTQGGVNTTLFQRYDQVSQTQVSFGLGATVGANYDLGKGWFTGVSAGYDWVTDKVNFTVGPNQLAVNASGWVVGLSIGRNF
jgi:hypothetical protein